MQNHKRTGLIIAIALIAVIFDCSKGKTATPVKNVCKDTIPVASKSLVGEGIRIAWDISTLKKVSASGPGYCGYSG